MEGSTNYLGAYNAQGQLKRVIEAAAAKERLKGKSENKGPDSEGNTDPVKARPEDESLPPETDRDMKPFPQNKSFTSQPVLSEELREELWSRVMRDGKSVRQVSAELGVEMSRVGAVVRLMEIEKEWRRIGKPLARPYAQAVMSMLPKTTWFPEDKKQKPHESINDLPVHKYTGLQIFHPTSESRQFTRADAAKVFHKKLLPADDRVPHPELAEMHKEYRMGLSKEERDAKQQAREDAAEKKRQLAAARQARKEAAIKRVDTGRWEFRFTDINVDDAGKDGRGYKGVGWRYGAPHMDRSRGTIKIPTSVE